MNVRSVTGRAVGIGLLCAAAMVVCFALAWWQWDRFSSVGGTFQNLGYVLQWPLFGLFPVFMVWRWRVLSRRRSHQDGREPGSGPEPAPENGPHRSVSSAVTDSRESAWRRVPKRSPGAVPAADGGDPEDPADTELAAYNRYLAELDARDQEVK